MSLNQTKHDKHPANGTGKLTRSAADKDHIKELEVHPVWTYYGRLALLPNKVLHYAQANAHIDNS